MIILEGLDNYQVREPLFEGLRIILSYLGSDYTPAYIQGISGAAFRIGGICPCAPTCSYAMEPTELLDILGYSYKHYNLAVGDKSNTKYWEDMIEEIKKDILNNRPVLVWSAFSTGEWDVVCGFDDKEEVFYGRQSSVINNDYVKSSYEHTKELDGIPAFGAIFIGEKVRNINERKAEVNALEEAVKHAYTEKKGGLLDIKCEGWDFYEGLQCYRRWSNDFKTTPGKRRNIGDAYCYSIYSSTHKAASDFLIEIAPKYGKARTYLINAAERFNNEAKILSQAENLLGWNSPEEYDEKRNRKAAMIIDEACDEYKGGIDILREALKDL